MALCFPSSFLNSIPRNLSDNNNLEELPNDVFQGASGPVILWVASPTSVCKRSASYVLEVNFLQFREVYDAGLAIKIKFYLCHLQRFIGQFRADSKFQ